MALREPETLLTPTPGSKSTSDSDDPLPAGWVPFSGKNGGGVPDARLFLPWLQERGLWVPVPTLRNYAAAFPICQMKPQLFPASPASPGEHQVRDCK